MYNNKLQYSWSDYDKDIKSIEWLSFDHVIGIFRGSIGMAAHISNKHSVPMSIVGLQTRDADDKYPYWILNNTKAEMVPNQEPETILIVDDNKSGEGEEDEGEQQEEKIKPIILN